jgi:cytochrome c oxidase subunit 2
MPRTRSHSLPAPTAWRRHSSVNPTAFAIAVIYSVACVVAIAAVLFIWRSTHQRGAKRTEKVDTKLLAHREKAWFAIVVAALGALLLATLSFIPYGDTAAADGQQEVSVEAFQFGWTIEPSTIAAGTPARFRVTASDVTHGFAVYNDDNVMLFQIQAIPGHPSHIVHTFDEPGRYQVVCLEFCGVAHHQMLSTLTVEPS